MKIVPAAKTKSAPTTLVTAAGNPKAQYGAEGTINANNKEAMEVTTVPDTEIKTHQTRRDECTNETYQ